MENKSFQIYWKSILKLTPKQTETKKILINNMKSCYEFKKYDCICGSNDFENIISKDIMGIPAFIIICKKCGLIFQNPRLSEKSLNDFYANFYYDLYSSAVNEEDEYKEMIERGRLIYEYINNKIPEFLNSVKNILEVGCNKGGIISAFSKNGYNVMGIDLDPNAVKFANTKNINVQLTDINSFAKNNTQKFDLVIYNHVLEHISDINNEMKLIKTLLTENGYIYIGVPSLLYGLKANRWHFQSHVIFDHIYYFNRETLRNTMSFCGFKEVACDDSPVINNIKGLHLFAVYQCKNYDEKKITIENQYYDNIAILSYAESKCKNIGHIILVNTIKIISRILPTKFKMFIRRLFKIL